MKIDFEKMGGLVPAIIQDADTRNVLMLGFMNEEAYQKTLETGKVTFWSRTRQTLWTKGETSGNFLNLVSMDIGWSRCTPLVQPVIRVPTPAGVRPTRNLPLPSFRNCKISLRSVIRRCPKAAIPPSSSAMV